MSQLPLSFSNRLNPYQQYVVPQPEYPSSETLKVKTVEESLSNIPRPESPFRTTRDIFSSAGIPLQNTYTQGPPSLFCLPLPHQLPFWCMNVPCPPSYSPPSWDPRLVPCYPAQVYFLSPYSPEPFYPPAYQNYPPQTSLNIELAVDLIGQKLPGRKYDDIVRQLSSQEGWLLEQLGQVTIEEVRKILNNYWKEGLTSSQFTTTNRLAIHKVLSKLHTVALLRSNAKNLLETLERSIPTLRNTIKTVSFQNAIDQANRVLRDWNQMSEGKNFGEITQKMRACLIEIARLEGLFSYFDHSSEILELAEFAKINDQLMYPECFKLFPHFNAFLKDHSMYRPQLKEIIERLRDHLDWLKKSENSRPKASSESPLSFISEKDRVFSPEGFSYERESLEAKRLSADF